MRSGQPFQRTALRTDRVQLGLDERRLTPQRGHASRSSHLELRCARAAANPHRRRCCGGGCGDSSGCCAPPAAALCFWRSYREHRRGRRRRGAPSAVGAAAVDGTVASASTPAARSCSRRPATCARSARSRDVCSRVAASSSASCASGCGGCGGCEAIALLPAPDDLDSRRPRRPLRRADGSGFSSAGAAATSAVARQPIPSTSWRRPCPSSCRPGQAFEVSSSGGRPLAPAGAQPPELSRWYWASTHQRPCCSSKQTVHSAWGSAAASRRT